MKRILWFLLAFASAAFAADQIEYRESDGSVSTVGVSKPLPTSISQGGTYNSTPPTLTNGQSSALQLDSSGALRVNPGALASSTDSVDAQGTYNATAPTLSDTNRGGLQLTNRGELNVSLRAGGVAVYNDTAQADGKGSASLASIGVIGQSYSWGGASWERDRNNVNTTTGDTGAKTATFNGATQTNYDASGAYITVILGTVTGTTPTMSMQLQWSPDAGTTWVNLGPATSNLTTSSQTAVIGVYPTNWSQTPGATPANLTTGATVSTFINAPLPKTWRLAYTIGGTTPSFTISSVQVNYTKY